MIDRNADISDDKRISFRIGMPELANSRLETSLGLSPHARRAGTQMAIGVGHFFVRKFDDAEVMLRSLHEHRGWAPTYRFLAACYAHMAPRGGERLD
jgi:hypothetical protein